MIFASIEDNELREVVVHLGTIQKKARFHKWTYSRNLQTDLALVEMEDGTMQYVTATRIRFIQENERTKCNEGKGIFATTGEARQDD